MFEVLINSVDKTDYIAKGSISIEDILTSQVDTANFSMIKNSAYIPAKGDEVIINYNGNAEFGGRVVDIKKSDNIYSDFQIQCQDWSVDLDRKKIAKVYNNMTAKEIIEDIVATVNADLGTSFTTTNVQDGLSLGKVVFNYQEGSKCIEELANLFNWQWYIDPDKDIHFFPKGTEVASFSIDDNAPDVIQQSLDLTDSFSELRNVVILRGGDFVGSSRTELYIADGSQTTINLAYKFSALPDVTINGSPAAIGVENLDNADLEAETVVALWDYNQKYLRFKTAQTAGNEISVTGTPLFPLIVIVEDALSIAEFGRKEHVIVDNNITSVDVAIERCSADLEAYKNGVQGGSFKTYTDGLKSGQTIHIASTRFDVDEVFLIRSVRMREHGLDGAIYDVKLANNKVIGIIEFLQKLLLGDRKKVGIRENEVPNIVKLDTQEIEFEETITKMTPETDFADYEIEEQIRFNPFTAVFVIAPYFPVDDADPKTPMLIGVSSYVY